MNTNTTHTDTNTEVAPVAQHRNYKKSVMEMYIEAVEGNLKINPIRQVSASGNEFAGLNQLILTNAAKELGYKSSQWFSKIQMEKENLVPKSEDDYGIILFSTKLVDKADGSKEKKMTYWRVFNRDSLETLPL